MSFEFEIKKQFNVFKDEMNKIRVDVLDPDLFSNVSIKGKHLKTLASISSSDRRTVQVIVWNKSDITSIQKELSMKFHMYNIRASENKILISMPELSEEYRNDLIKKVKHEAEQSKIKMRTLRQKYNKKAEVMNNPTSIKNKNQDIINDYCSQIDSEVKRKISILK